MLGVLGASGGDRRAFDGDWFHSGDLVRRDAEGFVEVVDRVKDVINTGGVLVASRQVEDAIFAMDGVAEVAVVGMADEKWIEAVSAFVVLRDDAGDIAEADVIAHVKDRLAGFKVPKRVSFVAELPKNSAGKILKRSSVRRERPRIHCTRARTLAERAQEGCG